MSNWNAWASNLALLRKSYRRPAGVFGMVTDDELHFLESYARFSYSGAGTITDLGCWLGATTDALARGVSDNPQQDRPRPIEAFDSFIWQDWMTPIASRLGVPGEHREGDDFFEETRAALAPWDHLVRLRRIDLSEETKLREPIEFLMIDAMKSWPLANAISRTFLPKLIPEKSLVVQQDFGYHAPIIATNHLLMWSLREWLEPVYQVPDSTSVVFFNTRRLRRHHVKRMDPERLTREDVDAAWRYSLGFIRPELAGSVRTCKLLFLLELGWNEAALDAAEEIAEARPLIPDAARADLASAVSAARARPELGSVDRAIFARIADLLAIG